MSLCSLPDEIILLIGEYMEWNELYCTILVNRKLAAAFLPLLLPLAVKDSGPDLLRWAARARDEKFLRKLLEEHKVNPNPPGEFDVSAMHIAAEFGYLGIATLLVQYGAGVNRESSESGNLNWFSHQYAKEYSRVDELRREAAWKTHCVKMPIHLASHGGHKGLVELLISNGADKDDLDISGRDALCCAVSQRHVPIVRMLVTEMGAKDLRSWESALFLAMWPRWNEELVELLLQYAQPDMDKALFRAKEVLEFFADDYLKMIHDRLRVRGLM